MHSQAALRGPDLHNSATTPALHIIAMSTPQACNMLTCFLFWLRRMMLHDPGPTHYRVHLWEHTPPMGASGNDDYRSHAFKHAASGKAQFICNVLSEVAEDSWVIFTDMDIMPLGFWSALPGLYLSRQDLVFQYNYINTQPVNVGFILMRNNAAVRDYMTRWRLLVDYWRRRNAREKGESHANDANDQALANLVLIRQYGLHGPDGCRKRRGCMAETAFFDDYPRNASIPSPRITLFDRDADGRQNALVTGADRFVTNGSYAVHAFGNANHSAKLRFMERVLEKPLWSEGPHPWQRMCTDAIQEASCADDLKTHRRRHNNHTAPS